LNQSTVAAPELVVYPADQTWKTTEAFSEAIGTLFQKYLPLKDALVKGSPLEANQAAQKLQKELEAINPSSMEKKVQEVWSQDQETMLLSLQEMLSTPDLASKRAFFSPLSDQLYHSIKKFEVQVNGYRQFCPMAFGDEGAFWLSDEEEIRNPYFGDEMLTCGNVEEEL
jgi:Cu(I)/Ag(I) efflux system membrane fusion protein